MSFVHRLMTCWFLLVSGVALPGDDGTRAALARLETGWDNPAATYRNHTRWWWPGNALTTSDITFQLEQMAEQGLAGVEIMSTWKMYERGHHEYLSPGFFALARHAVSEARRLGLTVSFTFGAGWSFGGPWVPPEDQSRALTMGSVDLAPGQAFEGELPQPNLAPRPPSASATARFRPPVAIRSRDNPPAEPAPVVAVVAARLKGNRVDPKSLTLLTDRLGPDGQSLKWTAPKGRWRLMAFRLMRTGQRNQAQDSDPPAMVVDHLNPAAVQRYTEYLGSAFERELGDEFGRTIEGFFCDSFEIFAPPNSLLWSHDTLARFKAFAGYDLTPWLPSLWYDLGDPGRRVRYDLGRFLHHLGLVSVYEPFNRWCEARGMKARIQPHYRFVTELVEAAGAAGMAETEFNTVHFATVPDPRKASASGVRFYGGEMLSAEAFTFTHPTRYRTTLEELKIAADAFLRDGVTRFYNHGYFGSPERTVAPSRDMPWANSLNHWDPIWPHYHHLASYLARASFMLRQGDLVAEVLIYSPQNTIWTEQIFWGKSRRVMPYGNVAQTLLAHGFDYDIVNDDLLQNKAVVKDGRFVINGHARRVLILPRALVVPIATLNKIEEFARSGGLVIALEKLPEVGSGLLDHARQDDAFKGLVKRLFSTEGGPSLGHFLPEYKIDQTQPSPQRQPWKAMPPPDKAQKRLVSLVRSHLPPGFSLADQTQSDGLTFQHRRLDGLDFFFVTNLQPRAYQGPVAFPVSGRAAQIWDARTGKRTPLAALQDNGEATTIDLNLAAWESAFLLFIPSDLAASAPPEPKHVPSAVLPLVGSWELLLSAPGFEPFAATLTHLKSWADDPRSRSFSGTGVYTITFDFPASSLREGSKHTFDLGTVGSIAEVELNQKNVGVAWTSPRQLDITSALRAGSNQLTVRVTNSLIHHVASLAAPPEVPSELQPRLGGTSPDYDEALRLFAVEKEQVDLPASGLLGPVRIVSSAPQP